MWQVLLEERGPHPAPEVRVRDRAPVLLSDVPVQNQAQGQPQQAHTEHAPQPEQQLIAILSANYLLDSFIIDYKTPAFAPCVCLGACFFLVHRNKLNCDGVYQDDFYYYF